MSTSSGSTDEHLVQFKLPNHKIKKMIFKRNISVNEMKKIILSKIAIADNIDKTQIKCDLFIDDDMYSVLENTYGVKGKMEYIMTVLNDTDIMVYELFDKKIFVPGGIIHVKLNIRGNDIQWLTKSISKVERDTSFGPCTSVVGGMGFSLGVRMNIAASIKDGGLNRSIKDVSVSINNNYPVYDNSGDGLVYDWGDDSNYDDGENEFIVW